MMTFYNVIVDYGGMGESLFESDIGYLYIT